MAIVSTNPKKLAGPWIDGYALDFHTISSTWTGDQYRYDTKRTELGDRVYRLKYAGATGVTTDIVDTAEKFITEWTPPIDCVVPVPPSLGRKSQPVVEIARDLAARLNL